MSATVVEDNLYLTFLIFLPVLATAVIAVAPSAFAKWIGLGACALNLLAAVGLASQFDADTNQLQFVHHFVWIESFNIEYYVGIDQLSFLMVVLTAFISFIAAISSLSIEKAPRGYWAMYMLLNTGMYGVFCALDFFLFYIFWEVMLLPMYFLIGVWGGPRKEYAAIKFFLYTLAGSIFLLLGMIAMYYNSAAAPLAGTEAVKQVGDAWMFVRSDGQLAEHTFNLMYMTDLAQAGHWAGQAALAGMGFTKVLWIGMFISFAIKVPMFPFHTWLPDAHVEAPTPVSAILAGVLLKMGCYGILRFNFGLFPDATMWAADGMAAFGMISIVYAALVCLAQTDLKKIIAYSSVSHMGFVLLGFAAMTKQGIVGGYFQMVSHGIVSPLLFLLVGVVYDRAHTRDVNVFGGLASHMPEYASLTGLAFFASLGLPGLAGFIGEALVFLGAFARYQLFTMVAVSSVIITAAYYLWTMQRVFLGKFNEKWSGHLHGMTFRERVAIYPLAVFTIVLGVLPMLLFKYMNTGLYELLANTTAAADKIVKMAAL